MAQQWQGVCEKLAGNWFFHDDDRTFQEHFFRMAKMASVVENHEEDKFLKQFYNVQMAGICVESPGVASIMLPWFVKNPKATEAWFDTRRFHVAAGISLRMLDNHQTAHGVKPTFNIHGLAEMLALMGLEYGTPKANKMVKNVARACRDALVNASIRLSARRGAYSGFDSTPYLKSSWGEGLRNQTKESIRLHGIRHWGMLNISYNPHSPSSIGNGLTPGIAPASGWSTTWPLHGSHVDSELLVVRNYVPDRECLVLASSVSEQDYRLVKRLFRPYIDGDIKPLPAGIKLLMKTDDQSWTKPSPLPATQKKKRRFFPWRRAG